jgi:hypothetical protein
MHHPAEGPPIGENPEWQVSVRLLSGSCRVGGGIALDRRKGSKSREVLIPAVIARRPSAAGVNPAASIHWLRHAHTSHAINNGRCGRQATLSEGGQMRERRLSCRQVSSTPSCGHASTLRRPAMPSRSPPYFSRRAPSRASAGGPYRYPGRQAWPSCLFQCPSRAPGGPAPSCRVQHPDDRVCGGQFLPCW